MVKNRAIETRPMIVRFLLQRLTSSLLDQLVPRCRATFTNLKQPLTENMEDESFR